MDGLTLLQEAREAGLMVTVVGEQLKIRGPRRADPIARKLIAHKPLVVNALQAEALPEATPIKNTYDLPPDWHFLWDERAAIMEYEGGLSREHAEAEALKNILQQMKDKHLPCA